MPERGDQHPRNAQPRCVTASPTSRSPRRRLRRVPSVCSRGAGAPRGSGDLDPKRVNQERFGTSGRVSRGDYGRRSEDCATGKPAGAQFHAQAVETYCVAQAEETGSVLHGHRGWRPICGSRDGHRGAWAGVRPRLTPRGAGMGRTCHFVHVADSRRLALQLQAPSLNSLCEIVPARGATTQSTRRPARARGGVPSQSQSESEAGGTDEPKAKTAPRPPPRVAFTRNSWRPTCPRGRHAHRS